MKQTFLPHAQHFFLTESSTRFFYHTPLSTQIYPGSKEGHRQHQTQVSILQRPEDKIHYTWRKSGNFN